MSRGVVFESTIAHPTEGKSSTPPPPTTPGWPLWVAVLVVTVIGWYVVLVVPGSRPQVVEEVPVEAADAFLTVQETEEWLPGTQRVIATAAGEWVFRQVEVGSGPPSARLTEPVRVEGTFFTATSIDGAVRLLASASGASWAPVGAGPAPGAAVHHLSVLDDGLIASGSAAGVPAVWRVDPAGEWRRVSLDVPDLTGGEPLRWVWGETQVAPSSRGGAVAWSGATSPRLDWRALLGLETRPLGRWDPTSRTLTLDSRGHSGWETESRTLVLGESGAVVRRYRVDARVEPPGLVIEAVDETGAPAMRLEVPLPPGEAEIVVAALLAHGGLQPIHVPVLWLIASDGTVERVVSPPHAGGDEIRSVAAGGEGYVAVLLGGAPRTPVTSLWWSPDGRQWEVTAAGADLGNLALVHDVAVSERGYLAVGTVRAPMRFADDLVVRTSASAAWESRDGRSWRAVEEVAAAGISQDFGAVIAAGDGWLARTRVCSRTCAHSLWLSGGVWQGLSLGLSPTHDTVVGMTAGDGRLVLTNRAVVWGGDGDPLRLQVWVGEGPLP